MRAKNCRSVASAQTGEPRAQASRSGISRLSSRAMVSFSSSLRFFSRVRRNWSAVGSAVSRWMASSRSRCSTRSSAICLRMGLKSPSSIGLCARSYGHPVSLRQNGPGGRIFGQILCLLGAACAGLPGKQCRLRKRPVSPGIGGMCANRRESSDSSTFPALDPHVVDGHKGRAMPAVTVVLDIAQMG